jgi:hypothetical protein
VEEPLSSVIECAYCQWCLADRIHTVEPLVPGPSCLEVEIANTKLEKYKLPGDDQISAELIESGGETLLPAFHKLFGIVPVHKKG